MKTVRELVGKFIYEHMERMTDLLWCDGQDAVMDGVVCLQERSGFTQGALIENAMYLYIHYRKNQDERASLALEKVHFFVTFIEGMEVKTWGKLAILRGLYAMSKEGFLDQLDGDVLKSLQEQTDYSDFLDKETMELRKLPSNYYHVAMACAGYREKLGWEPCKYSTLCLEKLMDIMLKKSGGGWMDEEVPYGRFDRYSMMIASELTDTLDALDKDIPEFVKDNLKASAEVMMYLANEKGDGVTYGRSLSVHGDSGIVEVLSTAFRHGLVAEENMDEAMSYCVKALEKVLTFWYRKEMGSFDIWNNGRTTNGYRQKHRILEVNLDMTTHLLHILENMEAAGLADYRPTGMIGKTDSWSVREVSFVKKEDEKRILYILKRGEDMFSLPLIGPGNLWKSAAYLPFPAKPMLLEAPPESYLPFLVPEVILEDGRVGMPIQYFEHVVYEPGDDRVQILAKGRLCRMDTEMPEPMDEEFETRYIFEGARINIEMIFSFEAKQITMVYAGAAQVKVETEAALEALGVVDDPIYFTPHGPLDCGKRWAGAGNVWKYSVYLE